MLGERPLPADTFSSYIVNQTLSPHEVLDSYIYRSITEEQKKVSETYSATKSDQTPETVNL